MTAAADPETTKEDPPSRRRGSPQLDRIWGRDVISHGFAGVPSILIRAQKRIGITPTQLNIIVQLLDYWHEPSRKPFPTKRQIAERIGVTEKTVQINIRTLEQAGLIKREYRKTAMGDYTSNIYHLDGLVARVQELEPDFTKARAERTTSRRKAEMPAHLVEEVAS